MLDVAYVALTLAIFAVVGLAAGGLQRRERRKGEDPQSGASR
ncbi:hypothetical protein [Mangrovactinospora gilvigrisea]|nr:hypothetical protein [Mangrovactinospora gilvigrisea]